MREDTGNLKLRYEHENNCNYLVYEEKKDLSEDYQVTMLGRNTIDHFLSFDIRQIDDVSYIYYDISSKQQITKLFEYGKLTLDDVKAVCRSISEMVRLAKNYMLDLDRVIVEPRYMYMDVFDKSIWFAYLPSDDKKVFSEGIRKLFEYILEHFDHSSGKQDVVQLYELYQHILIGDYDPENLLLLFYGEDEKRSDSSVKLQDESENYEKSKLKKEEAVDEIIVDSVVKEVVDNEQEIADHRISTLVRCARALCTGVMLYGIATLFIPRYVPIRMTSIQAGTVIFIFAAVYVLLLKYGKRTKDLRRMIHHSQELEYKFKESDIRPPNELKLERTIITDMQEEKIVKEKLIKKEPSITPQLLEDNIKSESEASCNYTVLLSDYLKCSKTKQLKLVLQQSAEVYREQLEELNEIEPLNYPFIIGSMKNLSDFVIGKPFISRMHACIQQKKSEYYIEDLNSTNGTYINEIRVEGCYADPLKEGDEVRFGMMTYKVEIS